MSPFRFTAIVLLPAGFACAQILTDPARLPAAIRDLDPNKPHASLSCNIAPIKPELNFGFRFQTGYVLRVPLNQYHGTGHHWYIVFRVTPEGAPREPVYYLDTIDLPPVVQRDFVADVLGVFLLGEGRYDVKWSLLDDLGRVCREEWPIEASLARSQRSIRVAMPPNTSGDLAWSPPVSAPSTARPRRVTVLVDAALPSNQGFNRKAVPVYEQWESLLGILSSLIERLRPATVRLEVFNMDQQRELFHQDNFTMDGINRVAHAADGLQQWSVDYRVLQNPGGPWDLLSQLVNQQMQPTAPPDEVVFLGVPWRSKEKMPASFPGAPAQPSPRIFYLQYRANPPRRTASGWQRQEGSTLPNRWPDTPEHIPSQLPPELPDSIEEGVRHLKGKVLPIYSPADLNKAIEAIRR